MQGDVSPPLAQVGGEVAYEVGLADPRGPGDRDEASSTVELVDAQAQCFLSSDEGQRREYTETWV